MFIVELAQEGLYGKVDLFQTIRPYFCHYYFHADHQLWKNKELNVQAFLERTDLPPDSYIYLWRNIRVPQMDGPETIRNRFAYTNIAITNRGGDNPRLFLRSILLLRSLHLPSDFLWKHASPAVKEYCRKIIRKLVIRIAEKVYAPDYVWKTKGCKTTLQLLQHKWDNKLLMAIPTM